MSSTIQEDVLLQTDTSKKFSDFDIPNFLVQSLEKSGIINPSPVQEKSLPFSLVGQDILASAQTGTGKTIAFLLPVITRMLENPESNCLIMAPTRELAVQIRDSAIKLIPRDHKIRTVVLIGGDSITKQFFALKGLEEGAIMPKRSDNKFRRGRNAVMEKPKGGNGIHKNILFIGTPGRIKDHIDRGNFKLDGANFVVLDETDRMLDLGFKETLEEIFGNLPSERQTLMFSATMPTNIISLSKKYLVNPARIDIEKKPENAPKINQQILKYSYSAKFNVLLKFLKEKNDTSIIFVKTKMGAEELSSKLEAEGFEVRAIHGDLKQRERDFVIKSFKSGKIKVMVATDVAARGLHIPSIMYVINYDLPQTKEDYIHRIGRTGRAGEEGNAITFVNEDDRREIKVAQSYMRTNEDLDDVDEDVRSFGRDYAAKRRNGGGFKNGRRDGRDRGGNRFSSNNYSNNDENRSYFNRREEGRREDNRREEGGFGNKKRSFFKGMGKKY